MKKSQKKLSHLEALQYGTEKERPQASYITLVTLVSCSVWKGVSTDII